MRTLPGMTVLLNTTFYINLFHGFIVYRLLYHYVIVIIVKVYSKLFL